jgi:hypothetical protein
MLATLKFTVASVCWTVCALPGASAPPMPQAGGFPNQAIKFVSPFPAGGGEVAGRTSGAFAAQLGEDSARRSRVVKLSGAKLDWFFSSFLP